MASSVEGWFRRPEWHLMSWIFEFWWWLMTLGCWGSSLLGLFWDSEGLCWDLLKDREGFCWILWHSEGLWRIQFGFFLRFWRIMLGFTEILRDSLTFWWILLRFFFDIVKDPEGLCWDSLRFCGTLKDCVGIYWDFDGFYWDYLRLWRVLLELFDILRDPEGFYWDLFFRSEGYHWTRRICDGICLDSSAQIPFCHRCGTILAFFNVLNWQDLLILFS